MTLDKAVHKLLVLWAADCAEHVLVNFEEKYPTDNRPRKAVEAGRGWVRGEITVSQARAAAFSAHAAARDADHAAARSAARAAGHAAATAHVAAHAKHAASYAAAAVKDPVKERNWQRQRLPNRLWSEGFDANANIGHTEDLSREVTGDR